MNAYHNAHNNFDFSSCFPEGSHFGTAARLTIRDPAFHELVTLLNGLASSIDSFDSVTHPVGKCCFGKLPRKLGFITAPIAERRPESMNRSVFYLHAAKQHFHGHAAEWLIMALACEFAPNNGPSGERSNRLFLKGYRPIEWGQCWARNVTPPKTTIVE